MSTPITTRRLDVVRGLLDQYDCSVAVFVHLPDIRWISGFTGSNALLLISERESILLTDPRYREQLKREVQSIPSKCVQGALAVHAADSFSLLAGARSVLIDPTTVTASVLDQLRDAAGSGCSWEQRAGLLAPARAAKTPEELEAIRGAQAITDEVYSELIPLLRVGMSELDVAAEVTYLHLRRGAERMSFEPIVASGPNGALPHARPGNRILERGDLVVLDMGCVRNGYASDMTRTVAIGKPSADAASAYRAVKEAQSEAIRTARAGMRAAELDEAARSVLSRAGLDQYFVHSLGHGVGLEVHEWPRVSSSSDDVLPDASVLTIEPGVYIPDRFGIRIEDMIVLRPNGCENLTASSRDLYIVD